ncbi:MAG: DUF4382 domain-containing protein [candidate division Zixibacteria bacterium]|nr:DUF4382 domain-containing protein [candidate division Zixibacteria bacterium]
MKKLLLFSLMALLVAAGCSQKGEDVLTNNITTPTTDPAKFVLNATTASYSEGTFTSPVSSEPDNINLTVVLVQLRKADDSVEWITVSEPNATYDFLDLVNGVSAELANAFVEPGRYTQLRLVLAETNEIVFDGISESLTVPSGTETGVKLSADLKLEGCETLTVTIIFDAATSVISTEQDYLLRPSFRLVIDSE